MVSSLENFRAGGKCVSMKRNNSRLSFRKTFGGRLRRAFGVSAFLLVALSGVGLSGAKSAQAATYYLSPSGSDSNAGDQVSPWRTLQKAFQVVQAGDTLLLGDGDYPGDAQLAFVDGTADKPITIQAINRGKAAINGRFKPFSSDGINNEGVDHVIFDGLIFKYNLRNGLRITHANGCIVRHCKFLNNNKWGLFTSFCDDLLIENNESAGTNFQHGIYVSNSGDRPIIRYNVVHDNNASGIQINADPMQQEPEEGTRGDGITVNAVVEGNILYNNGNDGTAALNFASLRDSIIRNNLVYNNGRGSGIALWDDQYSLNELHQGDLQYGSKNNQILNNTVYFPPGRGKRALQVKNGSTGNIVKNNIFVGGLSPAIEIDNDSSIVSDYNLLFSAAGDKVVNNEDISDFTYTLQEWRQTTGNDLHSLVADPLFFRLHSAPLDFHLRTGSPAIDAGVDMANVGSDLGNGSRPQNGKWDLGAYETPQPGGDDAIDTTPPATPTQFSAVRSDPEIDLQWAANAEPDLHGYYLYRFDPAATDPSKEWVRTFTQPYFFTERMDTNISLGNIYEYRISAVDVNGNESPLSDPISVDYGASEALLSTLTVPSSSIVGGNSVQATLTFNKPAPAGGADVVLAGGNGLLSFPASVTVPEGQTTLAFTVTAQPVNAETNVSLTATYAGIVKTASIRVAPPPPSIKSVSFTQSNIIGGDIVLGTVTLSNSAPSGTFVTLTSSSPAIVLPLQASLTFGSGASTAEFFILTFAPPANATVTITASLNGDSKATDITVLKGLNQVVPATVTVNPASVQAGNTSSGLVTLSGAAPSGGAVVLLSSDNAAASVPASVTVPAGQNAAAFTVTANSVAANTDAKITAAFNGISKSATLTVMPGAGGGPLPSLTKVSITPLSVIGGNPATVTVTLDSAAPTGGAVVALSSDSGYATLPASVTVPAGQTSATAQATTTLTSFQTGPLTAATQATLSATYNGATKTAALTIMPQPDSNLPALTGLTFNVSSLVGGRAAYGTVTLSQPAPAGGATVLLSSSDPALASIPASVHIPARATGISFVIITRRVKASTGITLSASYNGAVQNALLTTTPAP